MSSVRTLANLVPLWILMLLIPRPGMFVPGIALTAAAFPLLALAARLWRRRRGRTPVIVDRAHVSHAGTRLARATLRIETAPWIVDGHVGTLAQLSDGRHTLRLAARGHELAVPATRLGHARLDACLTPAALERLLRLAATDDSSSVAVTYRSVSHHTEEEGRTLRATPVAKVPSTSAVFGAIGLGALLMALSNHVHHELLAGPWHSVPNAVASSVMLVLLAGRAWRTETDEIVVHQLRVRGHQITLEKAGQPVARANDARRGALFRVESGRACLELVVGTRALLRFVRARELSSDRGLADSDYVLGPADFDWLVEQLELGGAKRRASGSKLPKTRVAASVTSDAAERADIEATREDPVRTKSLAP